MDPASVTGGLPEGLADRYRIERELGRGAMGTVYLARDVKHERRVAVKVLRPELSAVVGRARFLREITLTANFTHPHILPLHDSGADADLLFYVMPYVDGDSLRDLLARDRQLPIPQALRIALEVADALAYAHARGVVHRDVKPGNILLESEHAVVADFGLAGLAGTGYSDHLTATGISLGTPLYMSPEQTLAQPVDERSDIYSLGCVLYEMLAGEPPFFGATTQAILAKKLYDPVPRVRVLRDSVSEAIEQVLATALCRNPADRYASAREFCRALEDAALVHQVSTSPDPATRGRSRPDFEAAAPAQGSTVARAATYGGALLALVTLAGFLTTVAYDVRMQMPLEYTPSRIDFPIMGIRALLPLLIISVGIGTLLLVGKYAVRLVMLGLSGIPRVGTSSQSLARAAASRWRGTLAGARAETIADSFLIIAVFASLAVIASYRGIFGALAGDDALLPSLACRSNQHSFLITFAALIVLIALGGRSVRGYLQARHASRTSLARVRWGTLVLVLLLAVIETLPWRVMWFNDAPRAVLDGQPAYILVENGQDLVIYNAEQRETQLYRAETPANFRRLNQNGYVFGDGGSCRAQP